MITIGGSEISDEEISKNDYELEVMVENLGRYFIKYKNIFESFDEEQDDPNLAINSEWFKWYAEKFRAISMYGDKYTVYINCFQLNGAMVAIKGWDCF